MDNTKIPFNLKRVKAGDPVITRSGEDYLYGAHNPDAGPNYKITGWIDGVARGHTESGDYYPPKPSSYDLFMKPTRVTKYINLFRQGSPEFFTSGDVHDDYETAMRLGKYSDRYFTTIPIEFDM